MSYSRLSLNRKRRLDYDSSDSDSIEDDIVPVRKQLKIQKPSFTQTLTTRCKTLWQWMSELPFTDFFKDSMYRKALMYTDVSDSEEDDGKEDNEDEVIDLDDDVVVVNDDEDEVEVVYHRTKADVSAPSSPVHRPEENGIHTENGVTQSPKSKPLEINLVEEDGCKPILSSTPFVRNRSFPPRNGYKTNSHGYLAPLSNPGVDVEILLESSPYTAHEVVRLQEKAQYKLLLEKVVNESIYQPVVKQHKTLEIDLTQDEDEVPSEQRAEHLKRPVDEFIHRYYREAPSIPSGPSPDNQDSDDIVVNVEPLPRYRPKPRPTASKFFSSEWVNEMKQTISYETEKRMQMVAQQEQKIKRFQNRRDAKIEEENRRRNELMSIMTPRIPLEKPFFSPLTEEQKEVIEAALDPRNPSRVLCSINRVDITHNDITSLVSLNWLNDTVINCYLHLIAERSKLEGFPSVHAFNSFFFTSLMSRGVSNVLRWTRKIDVFAKDILFVPLHLQAGMHWALGVIDNRKKVIRYYDSLCSNNQGCLQAMQKYLVAEMKDKKKIDMDPDTYTLEVVKDIPKQQNGSDCGMFTLKYAEYISRDAPINFTQLQMPLFRNKVIYELVTQQLL